MSIDAEEVVEMDDDPTMADEATATAILRRLGEAQRQAADVESLYEHFEQELAAKLAKLQERKAERLAPLRKSMADAERWLDGWHRAQVGEKNGKPTRLTIHLPTGTLKLSHQPPDVEIESPEHALVWAEETGREEMVVYPEPKPAPMPRVDGRKLRSFCVAAIKALPEEPEPGTVWAPVPGVAVTVKARKFEASPDI
jgi:phage host-nuclease inhibitor protein Gam